MAACFTKKNNNKNNSIYDTLNPPDREFYVTQYRNFTSYLILYYRCKFVL